MISKIGIRQFAVEQAVAIMGTGTPQKDVVAKAAEIEAYVVGEADIPEVSNDTDTINDIMGNAMQMFYCFSDLPEKSRIQRYNRSSAGHRGGGTFVPG